MKGVVGTVGVARAILGCVACVVLAVVMTFSFSQVYADSGDYGNPKPYKADKSIDVGSIVELTGKKSDKVKVATKSELQNMFGVAIDKNTLPIVISADKKTDTYVAVSGTHDVLVSTEGGDISKGDYLTLSSVDGVAMKADTKVKTVFGRAGASFNQDSVILSTMTLKDTEGRDNKSVAIGKIPATIDIRQNPNTISTKVSVPKYLEKLGQQIARKRVSPIRIYLSLFITAVSLFIALVILYSGIRHSIIAIGRNPMSKISIFRSLAEIIFTSLLVLIIGLFAVYLLLKL